MKRHRHNQPKQDLLVPKTAKCIKLIKRTGYCKWKTYSWNSKLFCSQTEKRSIRPYYDNSPDTHERPLPLTFIWFKICTGSPIVPSLRTLELQHLSELDFHFLIRPFLLCDFFTIFQKLISTIVIGWSFWQHLETLSITLRVQVLNKEKKLWSNTKSIQDKVVHTTKRWMKILGLHCTC